MKNLLVLLVAIGLPLAYWYQLPEPPKPAEATPLPVAPVTPVKAAPFVPAHSALDEPPASTSAHHKGGNSVSLGNDASPAPKHH